MQYDFKPGNDRISIPESAYKPVKRCPYCQSVFLTDTTCEACGRSLLYHPIGKPFSAKSFYGLKERYIEKQHAFVRFYPQFENRQSKEGRSYLRQVAKRFTDLVSAFNSQGMIEADERKLFYVECVDMIDELLRSGIEAEEISLLLDENDSSLIGRELLQYLETARLGIKKEYSWYEKFLSYRVLGVLRMEFFLKCLMITATVLTVAVKFKDIISVQFGR